MVPVDTPEIDIDQFTEALRGGAAIVGVREPGEYVVGGTSGWARSGRPVVGGSAPAPESLPSASRLPGDSHD